MSPAHPFESSYCSSCWQLANRHSVPCHLYFYFSIMNDYLRVDHRILKEKKEEGEEKKKEKKKQQEQQHVFSLTDSSQKSFCRETQLYFQRQEQNHHGRQISTAKCLTSAHSLLLQNFILERQQCTQLKISFLPDFHGASCGSITQFQLTRHARTYTEQGFWERY